MSPDSHMKQVISPPTYSLFWLQTLYCVLTKPFHYKSFLFVLLEPFSCVETNTIQLRFDCKILNNMAFNKTENKKFEVSTVHCSHVVVCFIKSYTNLKGEKRVIQSQLCQKCKGYGGKYVEKKTLIFAK